MSNLSGKKSKNPRKLVYKRRPKSDGQLLEEAVDKVMAEQYEIGAIEPSYVKPVASEFDLDTMPRAGKGWRDTVGTLEPESEKTVEKIVSRRKEKLKKDYPVQDMQATFSKVPDCPPMGCWNEEDHQAWIDQQSKTLENALTRDDFKNWKSTNAHAKDIWYTNRHPEIFGGDALTPEEINKFDAKFERVYGTGVQSSQPSLSEPEPIEMDPETIAVNNLTPPPSDSEIDWEGGETEEVIDLSDFAEPIVMGDEVLEPPEEVKETTPEEYEAGKLRIYGGTGARVHFAERAYAARETSEYLNSLKEAGHSDAYVRDISGSKVGEKMKGHKSHRFGLDIDMSIPILDEGGKSTQSLRSYGRDGKFRFKNTTAAKMDKDKALNLVRHTALHANMIFLDKSLIAALDEHAKKLINGGEMTEEEYERIFKGRRRILRHTGGHSDHFHIRIYQKYPETEVFDTDDRAWESDRFYKPRAWQLEKDKADAGLKELKSFGRFLKIINEQEFQFGDDVPFTVDVKPLKPEPIKTKPDPIKVEPVELEPTKVEPVDLKPLKPEPIEAPKAPEVDIDMPPVEAPEEFKVDIPERPEGYDYTYSFAKIGSEEDMDYMEPSKPMYGASMNKPVLALINLMLAKEGKVGRGLTDKELGMLNGYTKKYTYSNRINRALSGRTSHRNDDWNYAKYAKEIGVNKKQATDVLGKLGLNELIPGARYGSDNKQSAAGYTKFMGMLANPEAHPVLKDYVPEAKRVLNSLRQGGTGTDGLKDFLNKKLEQEGFPPDSIKTIRGKGGYTSDVGNKVTLNTSIIINDKYVLSLYTNANDYRKAKMGKRRLKDKMRNNMQQTTFEVIKDNLYPEDFQKQK